MNVLFEDFEHIIFSNVVPLSLLNEEWRQLLAATSPERREIFCSQFATRMYCEPLSQVDRDTEMFLTDESIFEHSECFSWDLFIEGNIHKGKKISLFS